MRWLPPLALFLPGCILDAEPCGAGFRLEGERCVPAQTPRPWYGEGAPDAAPAEPDAAPGPDAAPPPVDADPVPPPTDRWSRYKTVLVVDRGDRRDARRTPVTPGYDLDAVGAVGERGELVGFLGQVLDQQINDPFDANGATQAWAAVGPPDARGGDVTRMVSLGTEGGYLFGALDLARPLGTGDRIALFEAPADAVDGQAEVFLCLDEVLSLDRCVSLGVVSGTAERRLVP